MPGEGTLQVFVSLVTSTGTLVLVANTNPHLSPSSGVLAQFCQFYLTFCLVVGLLEKATESFDDATFG
jgi:hypothetical protein